MILKTTRPPGNHQGAGEIAITICRDQTITVKVCDTCKEYSPTISHGALGLHAQGVAWIAVALLYSSDQRMSKGNLNDWYNKYLKKRPMCPDMGTRTVARYVFADPLGELCTQGLATKSPGCNPSYEVQDNLRFTITVE